MNQPFFTVITVCYNSKSSIETTIDSVVKQSFSDWEYILVDGGSTDGTIDIIQEYKKNYENVSFISEKDEGIYDAMNKGIRMSKGKFIFFLNSADSFHDKNVLQKVFDNIKQDDQIYYGDVCRVLEGGKVVSKEILNDWRIFWARTICHQTIFSPSIFLKEHTFELKYKICADQEWIYYCKSKGIKFCHIDLVICDYDMNGVSSDDKNREICLRERLLIQGKYYPFLNKIRKLTIKMSGLFK